MAAFNEIFGIKVNMIILKKEFTRRMMSLQEGLGFASKFISLQKCGGPSMCYIWPSKHK